MLQGGNRHKLLAFVKKQLPSLNGTSFSLAKPLGAGGDCQSQIVTPLGYTGGLDIQDGSISHPLGYKICDLRQANQSPSLERSLFPTGQGGAAVSRNLIYTERRQRKRESETYGIKSLVPIFFSGKRYFCPSWTCDSINLFTYLKSFKPGFYHSPTIRP